MNPLLHLPYRRPLLVGTLFTVYAVVFLLFYPTLGQPIVSLLVLPLAGSAWVLGLRASLVAWLIAFPLQAFLYHLTHVPADDKIMNANALTGMFVTLVICVGVGHMRAMGQALRREVAERKRTAEIILEKEKLQVALDKEKELVQLKNQFMTVISHEFRTPLAIIQSSSEMLERYHDQLSPTRRNECVTTIKSQVHHVSDMLNDMSLVVNGDAAYLEFKPMFTDLAAFCRKLATDMALIKSHQITFRGIGDLSCVSVDTRLLQHILNNLLSNAVKYSPNGAPVQFTARHHQGEIILVVQDHGIGIPPEDQERVFDTFFRASNVGNIGGTGLGLRIVRDYLALHKGTISMVSNPGGGSIFTVRLPIVEPETIT